MKKWSSQWTQFMQLRKEAWKKFRTLTGFERLSSFEWKVLCLFYLYPQSTGLDFPVVSFVHILIYFLWSLSDEQTKCRGLLSPPTKLSFSVFLEYVQKSCF